MSDCSLKKVVLAGCEFDPLLDDAVGFAQRLKKAGVDVSLRVWETLPHGFLSFRGDDIMEQAQTHYIACLRESLLGHK